MSNNNEIAIYGRMTNPMDAIDRIGEMFAKSGMFGCERLEQGKVLALICLAENKSPVMITRDYDIVDGKLRKKSLASLADFRAAGGKHKWIKTGDDGKEAVLELTFEGQTITTKFSIEDAKVQGLVRPKSNWEKTPGNMLRARAVSNGVAMLCPEIFAGGDEDQQPSTQAPAEPLLKSATAKPVTKSEIIDVQAVKEPPIAETPPSSTTAAPSPTLTADNKPFTAADVQSDASGRLTLATVQALEQLIGDAAADTLAWLTAKGWIKNNLSELGVDRARRIFDKPAVFLGYVKGAAK